MENNIRGNYHTANISHSFIFYLQLCGREPSCRKSWLTEYINVQSARNVWIAYWCQEKKWNGAKEKECQGLFIINLSLFFVPVLHRLLISDNVVSLASRQHILIRKLLRAKVYQAIRRERIRNCFYLLVSQRQATDKTQRACWCPQATNAVVMVVMVIYFQSWLTEGFPGGLEGKESACNAGYQGWKDALEKGTATYSNILEWRVAWTVTAWRATVCGVPKSWMKESDTTERLTLSVLALVDRSLFWLPPGSDISYDLSYINYE